VVVVVTAVDVVAVVGVVLSTVVGVVGDSKQYNNLFQTH